MKRLFPALFLLLALLSSDLYGQTINQCGLISVGKAAGQVGDIVALDVRAQLPSGVGSFQFRVHWDTSALQFIGFDTTGTALPELFPSYFGVNLPGNVLVSWFNSTGQGVTLPPDALLYRLRVRVRPGAPSFSPVTITNDNVMPFEVSDASFELLPDNRAFGGVWMSDNAPTSPKIAQLCISHTGCGASLLGAIDLSVAGGTPPYQYSWSGPGLSGAYTEDLDSLTAGEYTVVVTDHNGRSCTAVAEVVHVQNTMFISQTVISNASCNSGGAISFQVSGGHEPYSFQWTPGGYTLPGLTNIGPGTYKVTVTDAWTCTLTKNFNVTSTNSQINVSGAVDSPGCGADSLSGTITLTSSGGSAPYSYVWSVPGQTGQVIEGLPVGHYTVTVTDQNGCTGVKTFNLTNPQTQNWFVYLNSNCEPNGPGYCTLDIFGNGSITWPLTVKWSNGATHTFNGAGGNSVSDTLTGLADGVYGALLTDSAGCQLQPFPVGTSCEANYIYDDHTCLSYRIGLVNALPGDTVALPVSVKTIRSLLFAGINISWDPDALFWLKYTPRSISGLNQYAFFNPTGIVFLNFEDFFGLTLPDDEILGDLYFIVPSNAPAGKIPVFSAAQMAPPNPDFSIVRSEGLEKYVGFSVFDGGVSVGGNTPSLIQNACANFTGDCAADRMAELDVTLAGGQPPYSISVQEPWGTRPINTSGTISQLLNEVNVVKVTDSGGHSASMALIHQPNTGDQVCTWPGDTDDDNVVNHFDVLYLGRGLGTTGIPRSDMGINWAGVSSDLWGTNLPLLSGDDQQADCDGDGSITLADTLAIVQNWGQVIRPGIDDPHRKPLTLPADPTHHFAVYLQGDTLWTDTLHLPLVIGTAGHPADSLLGLAFSIYYDTVLIDAATVRFQLDASWLGGPDEVLWMQKNFPHEGRIDLALTRKGVQPVSGFGVAGHLHCSVRENLSFAGQNDNGYSHFTDTSALTSFRPGDFLALGAFIRPMVVDEQESKVLIIHPGAATAVQAPGASSAAIRVYPNPAQHFVVVSSPSAALLGLRLCNSQGLPLHSFPVSDSALMRIDLDNFPAGLYLLEINTDAGRYAVKIILQH